MEVVQEYIFGYIVKWCWSEIHQNTYIILEVRKNGAILKQNFGGGQILNSLIPISELEK
jgi:hypothetical protein